MFPTNYVQITEWTCNDNFFTRLDGRNFYNSLVNADQTDNGDVRSFHLSDDLQAYLNQYFPGWRLLREVIEGSKPATKRYPRGQHWKDVHYVIAVGTDADAETLASHLRKTDYKTPG